MFPQVKERNLTHTNLPSTMRGVTATGDMLVSFKHVRVTLQSADPELNGKTETRLTIRRQPKGDRQTASVRYITEEQAMDLYPVEYQHFVDTGDVPTQGTPLDDLPGISRSQIDVLVLNGVRSVEDVLAVGADRMASLGYSASKVFRIAQAWDEKRRGNVDLLDIAETQAKMATQLENLTREKTASAEYIKQLEAQIAAMQKMQGKEVTSDQPVLVGNDESAGLETDVEKMANPWGDGDDLGDAADDLGMDDPDPLSQPVPA